MATMIADGGLQLEDSSCRFRLTPSLTMATGQSFTGPGGRFRLTPSLTMATGQSLTGPGGQWQLEQPSTA